VCIKILATAITICAMQKMSDKKPSFSWFIPLASLREQNKESIFPLSKRREDRRKERRRLG
jgi:hypothetical protein